LVTLSIRVLITDDHPAVRTGLAELLATAEDMEVIGIAACGAEGIRLTQELQPDVVLMDLSMPKMDGRAATEKILALRPQTRVILLTAFADRTRTAACGAVTTVLKDAPPAELLAEIRGCVEPKSQPGSDRSHRSSGRRASGAPSPSSR
jgi:DNA-binding NarL/FixJ family response regulator